MSNFGYGSGSRPRAPVGSAPLIAFAGDSVTAATLQANTATLTANTNRGAPFWVPCLTKQRVRTTQALNFGVSGNTSAGLLARIGDVVACPADYIVENIGTNDVNGAITGSTFAGFRANKEAIWDALLNAGKVVIAAPPLARDIATAENRATLWRMIDWVRDRQWAGRRNFYVVDPNPRFVEFGSNTGAPRAGYTYDGLHPKAEGALAFSQPIADLLLGLLPAQNDSVASSVADVFDAANNPTGNHFANLAMTGTGGTRTDAGAIVSGTIPDNWRSEVFLNGATVSSLTITHSAPAAGADGRPVRQIALGGSYVGGWATIITFRQLPTNYSSFAPGDRVICEIEYETDAGGYPQCIAGVYADAQMTMDGVTTGVRDGVAGSVADAFTAQAHEGVLRTPPLLVTAQPTFISAGLTIQMRQAGSNTLNAASAIRIKGMSFRKVIA